MSGKEKDTSEHQNLSIYLCMGLAIGTAIGVVLKNIPLWMSIGMLIGTCIGATLDYEKQKKLDKENDEKME